jgi:hypothetical protein
MENKHTPGPWGMDAETYSDSFIITDSRGFEIVDVHNWLILSGYAQKLGVKHWSDRPGESSIRISDVEYKANGHLIAAAPELLEALEELLALSEVADVMDEPGRMTVKAARAAIAKAYGNG